MERRTFLTLAAAMAASGPGLSRAVGDDGQRQPPLDGLKVDHVSIHVADFDGAMTWYREKLGFNLEVAWQVAALGGKRLAYLSRDGFLIEIVHAAPVGSGLPPVTSFPEHFARTGYGHVCFATPEIDAVMADLERRGVPAFVRAETYPLDGTPHERRVAFVRDPEGNVIEFAGPLRRRDR